MLMKYLYPALFTLDMTDKNYPNGVYLVNFPDISGCFTDGETLNEAYSMAEDALNLMLCSLEDRKEDIPTPTDVKDIKCDENSFVSLISADTLTYRKLYDKKAVKKTLSIPAWLNNLALERNINFSNTLQNALIKELGIENHS